MHRLGKKAGGNRLPTGERVESIKISGRTSVFVPSVQGYGRDEESERNEESKTRNEEKDFEAMKLEANAKGWLLQRRKPSDDGFEEMRRRARDRGWLLRKRVVEEDAKV